MDESTILAAIDALIMEAHKTAVDHGFWDSMTPRNQGEMIALMHSELSEALEALRNGRTADKHCPTHDALAVELADVLVRIFDFCGGFGVDLAPALRAKMAYNKGRPLKHGKKF